MRRVNAAFVALPAFFLFAGAASVDQLAAQLPSCSKSCLASAAAAVGCAVADYACQCKKSENDSNLVLCVYRACPLTDYSSKLPLLRPGHLALQPADCERIEAVTVMYQICAEFLLSSYASNVWNPTTPVVGGTNPTEYPSQMTNNGVGGSRTSTNQATGEAQGNGSGSGGGGSSGGLSAGATAGIAAGVTLGTIAISGMLFTLFWRRRKQRSSSHSTDLTATQAQDRPPPAMTMGNHPPELVGKPVTVTPVDPRAEPFKSPASATVSTFSPSDRTLTANSPQISHLTTSPPPTFSELGSTTPQPPDLRANLAFATYPSHPQELGTSPVRTAELGGAYEPPPPRELDGHHPASLSELGDSYPRYTGPAELGGQSVQTLPQFPRPNPNYNPPDLNSNSTRHY
jgi:hypothetical protein